VQSAALAPVGRLSIQRRGLLPGVGVQRADGIRVNVDGGDPLEESLDALL